MWVCRGGVEAGGLCWRVLLVGGRGGETAAKVAAGLPDSARPVREWGSLGADVGGPGPRWRGALGWGAGARPGVPAGSTRDSVLLRGW